MWNQNGTVKANPLSTSTVSLASAIHLNAVHKNSPPQLNSKEEKCSLSIHKETFQIHDNCTCASIETQLTANVHTNLMIIKFILRIKKITYM